MDLLATDGLAEARPALRKRPPEGVVEIVGIGSAVGVVALKDGSVMLLEQQNKFRISRDAGATWSDLQSLNTEMDAHGSNLIRLESGPLALFGTKGESICISLSHDEAKTWGPPAPICPRSGNYPERPLQLDSGRLLFPFYFQVDGELVGYPSERGCWGIFKGHAMQVESQGHRPELGWSFVYCSDDEGQTWHRARGNLYGWFDATGNVNGSWGQTCCSEPTITETRDGRVLLLGRSTVGRLVGSYSHDGGQTWYPVLPTELAASQSPACLVRSPRTGDLLCVWNQVSHEEIRRGYRRSRLSAAISKDNGATWEHFKTLELSAGMDDVARITPEYPLLHVRGRQQVGQLPDDFVQFAYPDAYVVGDKVYLTYYRRWPHVNGDGSVGSRYEPGGVLRVYPLEWFYQ